MLIVFTLLSRIIIKFYVISAPRKLKFSETKKRKVGKVNAHGRRNSKGGLREVGAYYDGLSNICIAKASKPNPTLSQFG